MPAVASSRACDICSRRKVKCDKQNPCSNCSKIHTECTYSAPVPSQRHRKRPAEDNLLFKIREYERLMRKHNVKFNTLDNTWISSPLEEKLAPQRQATRNNLGLPSPLRSKSPEAVLQDMNGTSETSGPRGEAARLWLSLPKNLRDPIVERLRWPGTNPVDGLNETESKGETPGLSLMPNLLPTVPDLAQHHPQPKNIFKLWQIFAEYVNPLSKVIHAPTLQQRIADVSWNLETVPKPLEAVMFAIYALAIVCTKRADCIEMFGESKDILLTRYRTAAAHALAATDLWLTRDLEVLQALVLFIMIDPRSELAVTLVSVAARIGHKMGLHRPNWGPQVSFFEQEMRVRVWWQIRCLDARSKKVLCINAACREDFGNVRLPLNVNDADLHPQMTAKPVTENVGATEIVYCRMKAEVSQWAARSLRPGARYNMGAMELSKLTSIEGMVTKRHAYREMKKIYEEKYLSHCDPSIPFHRFTITAGRLNLNRKRFWCFHPRHQPDQGLQMTSLQDDEIFESSVRILELEFELRATQFAPQLLEHMTLGTQIDALVYMISELRRRTSGDLVKTAWVLVGKMYRSHSELVQEQGQFYAGLRDLTLEAWEARQSDPEAHEEEIVSECIRMLQKARGGTDFVTEAAVGLMEEPIADDDFQIQWMFDELDWCNWGGYLEL